MDRGEQHCAECDGEGNCARFDIDLILRVANLCKNNEGPYRQRLVDGWRPGKKIPETQKTKAMRHGPGWGTGTELIKIFRWMSIGLIHPCQGCKSLAVLMDRHGVNWCEQNMEIVLNGVELNAKKMKIPFNETLITKCVRWAIKRARRQEKKENKCVGACTLGKQK
jgi:hypothetical protein